jgi:hypothetical protein
MSAAWCCITQNFPKKDVSSMIPPLYDFDTSDQTVLPTYHAP